MTWADSELTLGTARIEGSRTQATVHELYRDYGSRAVRLAYLLTGDRSRAEDAVQDAFVRLLGRLRTVRDPSALWAYLSKTVINLVKNDFRRESVRRSFLRTHHANHRETTTLPDLEERDQLHRELLQLPYRQRAALVLRYCEDWSEAEVADALATSTKAVRSLVGRGLSTLRNGRKSDG